MAKKSNLSYWENRFLRIEENRDMLDRQYINNMEERYSELSEHINEEIDDWMRKYAVNDEITEDMANTLLNKKEQRQWQISLEEFREKAISGGYEQQLNREYYRSRITRLQQLENQLTLELADVAHWEEGQLQKYLEGTTDETYMQTLYELSDRGSFDLSFARFDSDMIRAVIYSPWQGANFSQRVWKHHLKTIPDKLSRTLSLGTSEGWGIDRMVDMMMEGVDKNLKNRMITLVQNESAHFSEEASQRAYRETGVEEYEWLATLETSTCEQCANLDGEIFKIDGSDSKKPIVDTHVNCRCTTVPVIPNWEPMKRWQRDPITGEGSVTGFDSFDEWKKKNKAA